MKEANKIYKKFKPRAYSERRTYLGELANDIAERDPNNKNAEHHYQQLARKEDKRASFGRIKYILKLARAGVNRAELENEGGNRILITDKNGIEEAIAKSNVTRLQQAFNTPLREEPLRTVIREEGNFEIWNNLMDNKVEIPNDIKITRGMRLWLNKVTGFQYNTKVPKWTTEEYPMSWCGMKE